MAFNFPSNPTAGQVYGNYTYNATTNAWDIISFSDGIPAGVIMAWGASTAPANWLICDGSAVSRSTYASLFNAIGTTYGTGDGSTTFNLPDLRGRVPVGKNGATFGTLGSTGGAEAHTLTEAQMPSHTHVQNSHNHTQDAHSHAIYGSNGGSAGVSVSVTSNSNGDRAWYLPGGIAANTTATNQAATATNQNTGGGQAHNNLQPYVVTNYIIKYSAANTPGDSELATRVGALETSDATTNKSGLVPIIPSSLTVPSGSGSVSSVGVITFSNAANVTMNNIFTSAYTNYRVVVEINSASATCELRSYYASGGTLNSTGNYNQGGLYNPSNSSTLSAHSGTGLTYFAWGFLQPATNYGRASSIIDVFTPASTDFSRHSSTGVSHASGAAWTYYSNSGIFSSGQSFDGFTIAASAGYISGVVRVYGYR